MKKIVIMDAYVKVGNDLQLAVKYIILSNPKTIALCQGVDHTKLSVTTKSEGT